MRIVTFLGTGDYRPVTYVWDDGRAVRRSTTHLFPLALAAWLEPEQVLVLLTAEAERGPHWATLRDHLGDQVQPVPIPPGRSQAELWQIFEQLAGAVPAGSRLVIDVTHGFRSLPLFAAVAALLLRHLQGVTLERILYGAYEARDPASGEAPVFDLTPLLDLADWLSGIEALERSGDGRLLAQRLRETHASAWRRGAEELPQRLQGVGNALEEWSEAIRLNRPVDAARAAHRLRERLQSARDELAHWAPPFARLANRLATDVAALAHPEPERLDGAVLRAQLAAVRYALDKGLVLQAVTMAREWFVSWYIWAFMPEVRPHWQRKAEREQAEKSLGELGAVARPGSRLAAHHPDWDIGDLWNQLAQLRNDLAHCGMRQGAMDAQAAQSKAQELVRRLQALLDARSG